MRKRTLALLIGAIPFVGLVLALPLVNRTHPLVLGIPFLLAWIVGWVAVSPLLLWLAEWLWEADSRCRQLEKPPLGKQPGPEGGPLQGSLDPAAGDEKAGPA